jgi:hypothetical protein
LQAIGRPNPILQKKPRKKLHFRRCPSLPHQLVHVRSNGSNELYLISRFGGILAIGREPPNNVILNPIPELDVVNKSPKLDKLCKIIHVVDFFQVNLLDPLVISQG